jgi:hypothetical protein
METASNDKPCRTCTDFKTWVKLQKKKFDSEQVNLDYLNVAKHT